MPRDLKIHLGVTFQHKGATYAVAVCGARGSSGERLTSDTDAITCGLCAGAVRWALATPATITLRSPA